MLSCPWITVADATQNNLTFLCCLSASEFNRLITHQTLAFLDWSAANNAVFCITLQASNKEYSLICQLFIPNLVLVAFINSDNATFGEIHRSTYCNIMIVGVGDRGKLR